MMKRQHNNAVLSRIEREIGRICGSIKRLLSSPKMAQNGPKWADVRFAICGTFVGVLAYFDLRLP